MEGFRLSEHIERSPEEVFNFITNHENAPRWITGVTQVEKLTSGPTSAGTRLKETRQVMGKEAKAEFEISAYEPPTTYAVTGSAGGMDITYKYNFTPEGAGTRVDLVCDIQAKGISKLMAPLSAWMMKRQDKDQLANLKAAIEKPNN